MRVKFTFLKHDQTDLSLIYRPFENEHGQLWLKSIEEFFYSNQELKDKNRIYNFSDYNTEVEYTLKMCNLVIQKLNEKYSLGIPKVRLENLQNDVNVVHTYFVDSDKRKDNNCLWHDLNEFLHGLEIIERAKNKRNQGQVFCSLPNSIKYDIPKNSYKSFTTKKHFGYCYANYSHIGRHILEMYNARDEDAHDDHVIPMNKISGDFYLWFGNNTSWFYDFKRMLDIKSWFEKNRIDQIVNMQWGDPRLAIGWLPVAKIDHTISIKDLKGLCQIKNIKILK